MRTPGRHVLASTVLLACALCAAPAPAQVLDAPSVATVETGHGKIALRLTAGPSGAPYGFTIQWMTQEDLDASGDIWPRGVGSARLCWASCDGVPTLNTGSGAYDSFLLGPGESVVVEIGDLADETGVLANDPGELMYGPTWGLPYAFTSFANGGAGIAASALGVTTGAATTEVTNCTFTVGYWKNHPEAWPAASLMLGTVPYSKTELLAILGTSVKGNGLVSLAHQLIAAKLNILNGASPVGISATLAAADAAISSLVIPPIGSGFLDPGTTSSITQTLDDFNNGVIGPGHCGDTAAREASWGSLKLRYR